MFSVKISLSISKLEQHIKGVMREKILNKEQYIVSVVGIFHLFRTKRRISNCKQVLIVMSFVCLYRTIRQELHTESELKIPSPVLIQSDNIHFDKSADRLLRDSKQSRTQYLISPTSIESVGGLFTFTDKSKYFRS